jgi:hypothetical protein
MTSSSKRSLASALALTAVLLATPASAQQRDAAQPAGRPLTIQAALASDVGMMADKFTGLARVMAGKYDWRPGPGVRSVGEVFNLIVMENKMVTGMLTGAAAPGSGMGGRGDVVTDPAQMQEALTSSFAAVKQALAGLSNADPAIGLKLFGPDTSRQGAALMLIMDQHEHLGQLIAYARSNNVVPPWNK